MTGDQSSNPQQESPPVIANATTHTNNSDEVTRHIATFASRLLDRADTLVYTTVGLCFLIGALIALIYSIWNFVNALYGALSHVLLTAVATDIIQFISDLLLVLIIMEVLSTVIHYLRARATSLQPFLFIGIISATRGILSIGARLSIGGTISTDKFYHTMIELGVNAAVVLALGVTLKILGKQAMLNSLDA